MLNKGSGQAVFLLAAPGVLAASILLRAQIETVGGSSHRFIWVSHGRVEGHLALRQSSRGAFSPDSSVLAAINEDKVVLMDLRRADIRKVLRPRVESVSNLAIRSADFLGRDRLFILASGFFQTKGKGVPASTPQLAFQWDAERDVLLGKVNAVGTGGGFTPARYFSEIGHLAMYKDSNFILWNPTTGRGPRVNLPSLTRRPNLYAFSPDGQWLLLAQIEASGTADPAIVQMSDQRFVDSLHGHHGTVLGMAFSRDSKKVVTACEDAKARIWSVPDWKLLQTVVGHEGPVHWAEFSSDAKWVVSAGEDRTVRIWSVEDGKLEQTLRESQAPLLTVAFSPNDEYVAASGEETVLLWQRRQQ